MALTIAPSEPHAGAVQVGPRRAAIAKITFDSSYPTGGEAFDPSQLGIEGKPAMVICSPRPGASTTFIVQYDRANKKLMVFEQSGVDDAPFDEVDDTTNLSTLVVDVLVIAGSGV